MKVLHVLYESLPSVKGSCIRSRDIFRAQRENGIEVFAVTSPFQAPADPGRAEEMIEGIVYFRTGLDGGADRASERIADLGSQLRKLRRFPAFARDVETVARRVEADVIHAHSTFFCGLAALRAARKLGIPTVYEIRSLWEERVQYHAGPVGTLVGHLSRAAIRRAESYCARRAGAVVTISAGLKSEIERRRVEESKVFVVPNAIGDLLVADDAIEWRTKRGDELTLGYVGNLSPIEGLDDLLACVVALRAKGFENKLLIYGAGIDLNRLEDIVRQTRIQGVEFRGQVPADQVRTAYEGIDVTVLPRKSSRLTEIVTPLKPLECLAYGRLTLLSDIGGHRELLDEHFPELLFKAGSLESLTQALVKLLSAESLESYYSMIVSAREAVRSHRNWRNNARVYASIYERLTAQSAGGEHRARA